MTERQADMLTLLAQIYLGLGRPRHALLLLHPMAAVDRSNGVSLRLAVRAHLALGQYDQAIEGCDRLLASAEDRTDRRTLLVLKARALGHSGRREAAQACIAEAGLLSKEAA